MAYNPHTSSTPPRSSRVMFGAVIAIVCLVGGMVYASHEFHKTLVMQGEPVEMDWQTLVDQGYGDNPHIRLRNVAIVDPHTDIDEQFGDEDLDEMMNDPALRADLQDTEAASAKVIPRGANAEDVPRRVVIAGATHFLDEGIRQLDETETITGMVSTYGVNQMIGDFIGFFTERPTEHHEDKGELVYTIVPIEGNPDLDWARFLFLSAGFGVSLGLILCGSGGPGFWTIWFAPLPSLLSLVGYPMRYGRGSLTTRVAYIAAGVVLMGYGYYMLISMGKFGMADGNPLFHAVGFASVFIGLSAVLAVPMQITMRSLGLSVEAQPPRKPVRMSWNQACSMEPVVSEVEYQDDTLVLSDTLPLSGELKEKAEELEAAGFTKAKSLQWQRELGIAAAAVQLGCQNMVVTDLEYHNDSDIIESGLISVLGTGLPIITISANSGIKQNRPTTNCLFQRASSSDPSKMLADHLELVVGEAEGRDAIVVDFDVSETQDVVHFARRVLAEIQGTINGQLVTVDSKRYGRFHYPPAPVTELVPEMV